MLHSILIKDKKTDKITDTLLKFSERDNNYLKQILDTDSPMTQFYGNESEHSNYLKVIKKVESIPFWNKLANQGYGYIAFNEAKATDVSICSQEIVKIMKKWFHDFDGISVPSKNIKMLNALHKQIKEAMLVMEEPIVIVK
ncbi:MAG: hypothetical protein RSC93_02695 [Erysipelotrichaceae bacterium]